MSILSEEPDHFGFFYGFVDDDHRQVNVRREGEAINEPHWKAYVGGDRIEGNWQSKAEAEAAAIAWLKANPDA
jgi:hypothetical protein